jgi:hypothetical protein
VIPHPHASFQSNKNCGADPGIYTGLSGKRSVSAGTRSHMMRQAGVFGRFCSRRNRTENGSRKGVHPLMGGESYLAPGLAGAEM